MLLLAGGACLVTVAAVCIHLLTGTPLYASITNTSARIGYSSVLRDRTTAVDTGAVAATGALDHKGLQAGSAFVPVQRWRDDEPKTPAGTAAAAGTPGNERAGNRRLSGGHAIENGDEKNGSGRPDGHGGIVGGGQGGAGLVVRNNDFAKNGDGDYDGGTSADDVKAAKDDGGGICSPLEVVGLDSCPEMKSPGVVEELLTAKAEILRRVCRL